MKKKFSLSKLVIFIILVYSGVSIVIQQVKIINIKKDIIIQNQELKVAKEANQKLQDDIELSKSNEAYFEKLARERLGYIKSGETPVVDNKAQ